MKDDDGDFTPSDNTRSNLSSLFGTNRPPSGNSSLMYTAPKEPKRGSSSGSRSEGTSRSSSGQLTLILAKNITAYKLEYEDYVNQGSAGIAIIGNFDMHLYQIILYKNKREYMSRTNISNSFSFNVLDNNYASYYDDSSQNWSILFSSQSDVEQFARQIAISKYNSQETPSDSTLIQDLLPPGQIQAGPNDVVQINFSCNIINNDEITPLVQDEILSLEMNQYNTYPWHEGLKDCTENCKRVIVLPQNKSHPWIDDIPENSALLVVFEVISIISANANSDSAAPEKSTVFTPRQDADSVLELENDLKSIEPVSQQEEAYSSESQVSSSKREQDADSEVSEYAGSKKSGTIISEKSDEAGSKISGETISKKCGTIISEQSDETVFKTCAEAVSTKCKDVTFELLQESALKQCVDGDSKQKEDASAKIQAEEAADASPEDVPCKVKTGLKETIFLSRSHKTNLISRVANISQGVFVHSPNDIEEETYAPPRRVNKLKAVSNAVHQLHQAIPINLRAYPQQQHTQQGNQQKNQPCNQQSNNQNGLPSAVVSSQVSSNCQSCKYEIDFSWQQQQVKSGINFACQQLHPITTEPADSSSETGGNSCFSETKGQESELRLSINRVSDKVDDVLNKLKEMNEESLDKVREYQSATILDPARVLNSIQCVINENECLKKRVEEQNKKIEEQNNKIHKLLEQNQSGRLVDRSSLTSEEMTAKRNRIKESFAQVECLEQQLRERKEQLCQLEKKLLEAQCMQQSLKIKVESTCKGCPGTSQEPMDAEGEEYFDEVKKIMNAVNKKLHSLFEDGATYSASEIKDTITTTIREVTLGYMRYRSGQVNTAASYLPPKEGCRKRYQSSAYDGSRFGERQQRVSIQDADLATKTLTATSANQFVSANATRSEPVLGSDYPTPINASASAAASTSQAVSQSDAVVLENALVSAAASTSQAASESNAAVPESGRSTAAASIFQAASESDAVNASASAAASTTQAASESDAAMPESTKSSAAASMSQPPADSFPVVTPNRSLSAEVITSSVSKTGSSHRPSLEDRMFMENTSQRQSQTRSSSQYEVQDENVSRKPTITSDSPVNRDQSHKLSFAVQDIEEETVEKSNSSGEFLRGDDSGAVSHRDSGMPESVKNSEVVEEGFTEEKEESVNDEKAEDPDTFHDSKEDFYPDLMETVKNSDSKHSDESPSVKVASKDEKNEEEPCDDDTASSSEDDESPKESERQLTGSRTVDMDYKSYYQSWEWSKPPPLPPADEDDSAEDIDEWLQ